MTFENIIKDIVGDKVSHSDVTQYANLIARAIDNIRFIAKDEAMNYYNITEPSQETVRKYLVFHRDYGSIEISKIMKEYKHERL